MGLRLKGKNVLKIYYLCNENNFRLTVVFVGNVVGLSGRGGGTIGVSRRSSWRSLAAVQEFRQVGL